MLVVLTASHTTHSDDHAPSLALSGLANRGVQWSKKIVSSPLLKETPDMCELYSGLNDKSDPCARSNLKNYGMCRKCRISLAKLGRIVLPWTRGFLKAGTTS